MGLLKFGWPIGAVEFEDRELVFPDCMHVRRPMVVQINHNANVANSEHRRHEGSLA